ncbi:MAG: hypothetical protein WBZ23_19525 [Pseudolabrys sp.]
MAIEFVELDLQIVGSCRVLGQFQQGDGRYRHSVTMLAAGHLESLPQCGDAIF